MALSSVQITSPGNNTNPGIVNGKVSVDVLPDDKCTLILDYSSGQGSPPSGSPPAGSSTNSTPETTANDPPKTTNFLIPATADVGLTIVAWAFNDRKNGPVFSTSIRVIPASRQR
jgi:hypothetical protein